MRAVILSLVIWLMLEPALAVGDDYFSAKIPVASQSATDRKVAIKQALEQVLVKISGSLAMPGKNEGVNAIAEADRYLRQYRYVEPTALEKESGITLLMKAEFDAGLVRQVIKQSGVALWPENRPQVLIWAIEDRPDGGRQFITDPKNPIILDLLARAELRGLPVLFPLWDLDDQLLLSDDQLWSFDNAAILAASVRYDVSNILAARYTETSIGEWFGSWQFMQGADIRVYDVRTPEFAQLSVSAIDPVVDLLVERYAVGSAMENTGALKNFVINGIRDYTQYQNALSYMKSQPLISTVELLQVIGEELHLKVGLSASWQQLDDAFALDRKLQSQNTALDPWRQSTLGTADAPAVYQWQ